MQVTLGKRGDYAVRAALWLALHYEDDAPVKGREIAEATAIPEAYLAQVISPLVRAGIVSSVAGPVGGYRLARPPAEVSLLDVVEASEGTIATSRCVLRDVPCGWHGPCVIHDDWSEAQQAFIARLAAADFDTLRRREAERRRILLVADDEDQVAG